jgi:hypothetical protein
MPKKTKREKLLAEKHRKIVISRVPLSTPPTGFEFRMAPSSPVQTITYSSNELMVIKKDLAKTVILAIAAIGTELFLSRILR